MGVAGTWEHQEPARLQGQTQQGSGLLALRGDQLGG